MFFEGNQIHNFMSSSGSGTVINYGSGSDFFTSYGSGYGSGSTSQKVTVPTVPVPVPQHCLQTWTSFSLRKKAAAAARLLEALTVSTWGPGEGGRTTGGCGLAALGAVRLNEIPRGFVGADTFA